MSITTNEILKTITDLSTSPYVKKVAGGFHDDSIAEEIYNSSAMSASAKIKLQDSLNVLNEAAKEPGTYTEEIVNSIKAAADAETKKLEKIKKEFEAYPKTDESFIKSKQKEIADLKSETKNRMHNKIADFLATEKERAKKGIIGYSIPIVIFVVLLMLAIQGLKAEGGSGGDSTIAGLSGLALFVSIITIPLLSIVLIGSISNYNREYKSNDELLKAEPNLARDIENENALAELKIEQCNEEIATGYSPNSEYRLKYLALLSSYRETENEVAQKLSSLKLEAELADNNFENGISILKGAIENFDSLNLWAANTVRDNIQAEYNDRMEYIESQKLAAQVSAQKASEKIQREAVKKQEELIKKQEQANAIAAKQAEDQAEIVKRLRNERYGEYYSAR